MTMPRSMFLAAGLWLLVLVCFTLIGTTSRPIADDYCQAAQGRDLGAVQMVATNYQSWSGRYTAYFVVGAMGQIGILSFKILPLLWLLGFALALFALLRQLVRFPTALLGTLFLSYVFWDTVSPQMVYWAAGSSSYAIGAISMLAFAAVGVAAYRSTGNSWGWNVAGLILLALAAGSSETFIVMQAALLILAFGGTLWIADPTSRFRVRGVLIAGFIGLALGAVLVLTAPGNAVRQAASAATSFSGFTLENLWLWFEGAVGGAVRFLFIETYGLALSTLTAFFTAGWLLWTYTDEERRNLPIPSLRGWGLLACLVFALVVLNSLPVLYGTGFLSARVMGFARLLQLGFMVLSGYLLAVWLTQQHYLPRLRRMRLYRLTGYLLLGMALVLPLASTIRALNFWGQISQSAADWDQRDSLIQTTRATGATRVTVPPLRYSWEEYLNLESIETEAWVGGCVQAYYGVEVIVSE